jgi:sugar phosphate isomerase/epimerase
MLLTNKLLFRAFAAALTSLAVLRASAVVEIPAQYKTGGFAIGCQAYSFNHYTVFEAIEKTAETGGKVIEFYPGQKLSKEEPNTGWDHNASDETIAKVQAKLKERGILAVNYGVVGIPKNIDQARKVFEFAKKLGLRGVTTESVEAIDTIEKLVKEYDIMVGFHDHPLDKRRPSYRMWDPLYVLSVVQDRDPRIGSCADIGHWVRSGLNPVDCLRILRGRIISSHLKDLNEFGNPDAHDVPFGTGVSGINKVLDELKAQDFQGNISIEYEYHWTTSVPEIKQSIDFVRAYGASR